MKERAGHELAVMHRGYTIERDIKPSVSDTRLHHGLHKSEFTPSGQKPEIRDVDQFGKPPSGASEANDRLGRKTRGLIRSTPTTEHLRLPTVPVQRDRTGSVSQAREKVDKVSTSTLFCITRPPSRAGSQARKSRASPAMIRNINVPLFLTSFTCSVKG